MSPTLINIARKLDPVRRQSLADISIKLVQAIMEHESDTFSPSWAKITEDEAAIIAGVLMKELVGITESSDTMIVDGVRLNTLLELLREKKNE